MTEMYHILLYISTIIDSTMQLDRISQPHMEWIKEECGIKNDNLLIKREATNVGFKIDGGQETVNYQVPWAVSVSISVDVYDHNGFEIPYRIIVNHCSGTLISNSHVLTAQHCFTEAILSEDEETVFRHYGYQSKFLANIIVGKANPDETDDFRHMTIEKSRFVPDLDYYSSSDRQQYDWVLLELEEKVPDQKMISKAIVPICLAGGNQPVNDDDKVQVYGQGAAENDPQGPGIMRYVTTHIILVRYIYYLPTEHNENVTYQPNPEDMVTNENIMAIGHRISPGDSGGGVTKSFLILKQSKPYCKHILIGIITNEHGEITMAIDVRAIVGWIESLTGIQAIDHIDDNWS